MKSVIRSPRTLGTALREARNSAALTQAELGRQTGLRQATISRLEQGEGGTLESLFAILTILKLDLQLASRSLSQPELDEIF